MKIAHRIGDLAVDLFGIRLEFIPGAEPGFDVADSNAMIESRERAGHRCSRVALSQYEIRFFSAYYSIDLSQDRRGELRQGLIVAHDVEIDRKSTRLNSSHLGISY